MKVGLLSRCLSRFPFYWFVYNLFMGKSTAAYIINNNQLLLLRDNIPTIKDPNKWDTPGGGCEGDESYEDCLIRELNDG